MNRKHLAIGAVVVAIAGLVYWWHSGHGDDVDRDGADEIAARDKSTNSAGKRIRSRSQQAPTFDVLLDDDPEGSLRLEGQVVDASLEPVEGAVVSIDSNPPRQARSAEDGSFFFDRLVGRPYRVVARSDDRFAGPVTARLTETNDPIILTLKQAARVEVTVRAVADGEPITGARVELRAVDTATGTSNQQGIASLRGIAPGRYWVMAVADGYAPDHSVLRIPGDTKLAQHEVELRRGAPVSGIVQTEKGKPVAGARVSYSGVSSWAQSGDPRRDAVLSDQAGRFQFPALPAGSFRFVARADGHAPGTSDIVTLNGKSEPSVVTVTVTAGATLAGLVVDKNGQPADSARVRVQVKTEGFNWGRPRQVFSDADGKFEMRNLPAKTVEVAALHDAGSSEVIEAELAPKSTANVTLELTRAGTIEGIVVDAAGEPVEGAQVVGWPSFGRGRRGRSGGRQMGRTMELTDAGGRFVLRGLESDGVYSLRTNPPGASRRRMWYREAVDANVGDKEVKLVLPEDGTVTGKIAFENGEPPEAFTVGIGFGAATPFSNRDGEFTLSDLPPRTYSLTLRGIGFDDKRVPEVEIEAGKVVDLGTITVRRGRRISGRIVDENGSPVGSALIRAGKSIFGDGSSSKAQFGPPWARNAKETRSDEDGNFV
ncbi:MAG: carboxypeptidase-like regulatory domain-containing protein, partial [Deltaproteobacteria bacterium]|nr:carboxypeptidase-like regulatory domain-containing protein [Deltaproteobacteria bacterium]